MAWLSFVRRFDHSLDNMARMMERTGADPHAIARDELGTQMGRAIRRCLSCRRTAACRSWLDRPFRGHDSAPDFCPNRAYFRETAG